MPLDGIENNHGRRFFLLHSTLYGILNGNDITATDTDGIPSECTIFGYDIAKTHNLVSSAVDLFFVPVKKSNKIMQVIVSSELSGFPYLSFCRLTIASNAKYPLVRTTQFRCKSNAACQGQPLAQTARGGVNPWHMVTITVSWK